MKITALHTAVIEGDHDRTFMRIDTDQVQQSRRCELRPQRR